MRATGSGATAANRERRSAGRTTNLSVVSWWSRRTLRARLTAAAGLVIAASMIGASALLATRLHASMLANLDGAAVAQVETVAADAAHGQLTNPLTVSGEGASLVQVIGADGRVRASSANISGEQSLFHFSGSRGSPTLRSVRNLPIGAAGGIYRTAALVASTPSGPVTVYAALSAAEVNQSVAELRGALVIGVPAVVALLVVVGWMLIGRALRPVEELRRQVAAIPGTDLGRRLVPSPADDELGRLVGTLNDLLARLETATDRHRQFVADAAHELRSPLASLRAQVEVARRRRDPTLPVARQDDLLDDIVRLSRLVDDLVALARLDATPRLQRRVVDVDDLLLEAARRVRDPRSPRVDTTGISAGRVLGDEQALDRMMQNLLDNAARHAATVVAVALTSARGVVTITVADDGPGIPAVDRARVFERFTRLDDARSRDAGGSGLGLAIVAQVVAAHSGQIRVDDNRPGARFTVTLPEAPR